MVRWTLSPSNKKKNGHRCRRDQTRKHTKAAQKNSNGMRVCLYKRVMSGVVRGVREKCSQVFAIFMAWILAVAVVVVQRSVARSAKKRYFQYTENSVLHLATALHIWVYCNTTLHANKSVERDTFTKCLCNRKTQCNSRLQKNETQTEKNEIDAKRKNAKAIYLCFLVSIHTHISFIVFHFSVLLFLICSAPRTRNDEKFLTLISFDLI